MLLQLFTCGCMFVATHATIGNIVCSDITDPVAVFKSATINRTFLNLKTGKYENNSQREIYERFHNANQLWQTHTHIITSHPHFNGSTRIISNIKTGNSTTVFVPRSSHWIREHYWEPSRDYFFFLREYIDRSDRIRMDVVEYINKTQEFKLNRKSSRSWQVAFIQDGKPDYGNSVLTKLQKSYLYDNNYFKYGNFQEINNSICHVGGMYYIGGRGFGGICYECENIAAIADNIHVMQWDKCSRNFRPDYTEEPPIPRRDRLPYFEFKLARINPELVVTTIGARMVYINNQSYILNRIVKFILRGEVLQVEDMKPHNYIGTLQPCLW